MTPFLKKKTESELLFSDSAHDTARCLQGWGGEWVSTNNQRVAGSIPSTYSWATIWKEAGITSTVAHLGMLHYGWLWSGPFCGNVQAVYVRVAMSIGWKDYLKQRALWQLSFLMVSGVKMQKKWPMGLEVWWLQRKGRSTPILDSAFNILEYGQHRSNKKSTTAWDCIVTSHIHNFQCESSFSILIRLIHT